MMTRLAVGFLVASLVTRGIAGAGENLISNGGFEDPAGAAARTAWSDLESSFYPGMQDAPAAGWRFGGGWDGGRYTVHLSNQSHSGRHALEIRCEKQGRGGVASTPFQLQLGTILQVSFWLKAQDAGGGAIRLNYEGTPGDGWDGLDIPGGTFDWQRVTKRCVVPVRHTQAEGQTLVLFIYSKTGGSIWIDDVSAEAVDVNALAESPAEPALMPPRPKDIPEPPDSIGYRLDTADALTKVYPDTDFEPADQLHRSLAIALARNEAEDGQLVIEAPWRDVAIRDVRCSDLTGPGGGVLPARQVSWRRVDFVETTFAPAYAYTYDECPQRHWGEVQKIAQAIKLAAPELRILQCLNEPAGVRALAGSVDVFDVYVAQYHQTGVADLQARGTDAWLAVCCYPQARATR